MNNIPKPLKVEFERVGEQLTFDSILETYTSSIEAKDVPERRNFSHITKTYSQLPKRVSRTPKNGETPKRTFVTKNGEKIEITIKPAILHDKKTGKSVLIYPKTTEDRVEDALAYLAAQGALKRIPQQRGIGVSFTIGMLQKTIRDLFRISYRHDQVRKALEVLAGTTIDVEWNSPNWKVEQKQIHRITGLTLATKIKADDSICFCWLNEIFVKEIVDGHYTVHDLRWQGAMSFELTEDLFKKICLSFKNASSNKSYHFDGRQFLENSGIGFYDRNPSKSWAQLTDALLDLIDKDVIVSYEEKLVFRSSSAGVVGRPMLENKIITVWPTEKLIGTVKFSHYARKKSEIAGQVYWETVKGPIPRN